MIKHEELPLVSIVVLNWNGLKDTKICLEHLEKLNYPNTEIIVVDNGSTKDQKDYLSKLKGILYVDNPVNRGFTGGHIDGLKYCSGEFILLLNNDAVIQENYISKALAHFSDPHIGAVGGRSYWWDNENTLFDESNPFYSFQEIDVYSGEALTLSSDLGVPQIVNNVSGSCVIIRRSVIDEVGYLYDRFFAYFEETDLFARLKRAGYKILYDPALHIWHRNGASSGSTNGSYFFYYQIFRNRLIFAMRNFEARFLTRFLFIYYKIAIRSLIKYFFKHGDQVMNKAYFRAALYNTFTLPSSLLSRIKLSRKLGKSTYNHMIYSERTALSIVIDCTETSQNDLDKFESLIAEDKDPLHTYTLVINSENRFQSNSFNINILYDKHYFDTLPANMGCLSAPHEWMLVCTPETLPNLKIPKQAIVDNLGYRIEVIAFGDRFQCQPYMVINKSLFEKMGGLGQAGTLASAIINTLQYGDYSKSLVWYAKPESASKTRILQIPKLDSKAKESLVIKIKFDDGLIKAKKIRLYSKLKNKHYRFYQSTVFIDWLLLFDIPIHLKLARLKNLILLSLKLKVKDLAREFKHIRNETIIYGVNRATYLQQRKIIKSKLKQLSNMVPTNLPVFIICYERLYDLNKLVTWLEKHNLKKIIFIDNGSTYPPLLDFYNHTEYQILKLNRNVGHTAPWSLGIIRALLPEDFYIVTDPDVIPSEYCPDDFISYFLSLHQRFFFYKKVGFGLRIDDLPNYYPLKHDVINWESQFWKQRLDEEVYEAGIDTTFALYKPFTYLYTLNPSIRTGFPYVASHLPWYSDPLKITKEEIYYRSKANSSINSWNTNEIGERYKKEMQKT